MNRRSTEVRVPSANIFFSLLFFLFFDASVLVRKGEGMGGDPVGTTLGSAGGWRSAVRDARFKNARRTLCQCCLRVVPQQRHWMTNRHGRDIRPLASVYLWCVAGRRRAVTGSRATREMPCSIGIACAESTIARDPLDRETGYRLIPRPCTWRVRTRPSLHKQRDNFRKFRCATRRALRPANTPPADESFRMQRIRGWTDHCDPSPPVIKLLSLNS